MSNLTIQPQHKCTMANRKLTPILMAPLLLAALSISACQTTHGNNTVERGILGAAAGAIAGAVIGNNAGDGDAQSGALIGAIIGGAGGAYVACRETGGCANQAGQHGQTPYRSKMYEQHRNSQSRSQPLSAPPRVYGQTSRLPQPSSRQDMAVNRRQYFDDRTGRHYFYDPVSKREYYENGAPKN